MRYLEWEETVSVDIRADSLWMMEAYRLALFAANIGWKDVSKLMQDRRTRGVADQLYRFNLCTQIIRLLLTMVPQQRKRTLRESSPDYRINFTSLDPAANTPFP